MSVLVAMATASRSGDSRSSLDRSRRPGHRAAPRPAPRRRRSRRRPSRSVASGHLPGEQVGVHPADPADAEHPHADDFVSPSMAHNLARVGSAAVPSTSRPVRIALVGLGRMGRFHLRALADVPRSTWSPSPSRTRTPSPRRWPSGRRPPATATSTPRSVSGARGVPDRQPDAVAPGVRASGARTPACTCCARSRWRSIRRRPRTSAPAPAGAGSSCRSGSGGASRRRGSRRRSSSPRAASARRCSCASPSGTPTRRRRRSATRP